MKQVAADGGKTGREKQLEELQRLKDEVKKDTEEIESLRQETQKLREKLKKPALLNRITKLKEETATLSKDNLGVKDQLASFPWCPF